MRIEILVFGILNGLKAKFLNCNSTYKMNSKKDIVKFEI